MQQLESENVGAVVHFGWGVAVTATVSGKEDDFMLPNLPKEVAV